MKTEKYRFGIIWQEINSELDLSKFETGNEDANRTISLCIERSVQRVNSKVNVTKLVNGCE